MCWFSDEPVLNVETGFLVVVMLISLEIAQARVEESENQIAGRGGVGKTQLSSFTLHLSPDVGGTGRKPWGCHSPLGGSKTPKDKSIEKPAPTLLWGQHIAYLDVKGPGSSPDMTFCGHRSEGGSPGLGYQPVS